MKLNELKPQPGSTRTKLQVGRGIGSGKGKTCGVGQKGQKSRSGVAINGFEGGQMPLYMRMPKFGFSNVKFATRYSELTLGKLQESIDSKKLDAKKAITEDMLVEAGVINNKRDGVKLLGSGALKAKVDLTVSKATKSAAAAVEKAGGKITFIERKVAPVKNGKVKGQKAASKL